MVDASTARPSGSSLARNALVAFAQSERTQADVDHVMRSLATHDSWYVPVAFAERAWGQTSFDQTLPFPEETPNPVLNVFSDVEAALLADGRPIGTYGGPVRGTTLMRSLEQTLDALVVNPASPSEHQWFIAAGGFNIARSWGSAIAVERALAERGNGPVPFDELFEHTYLLLMEKSTQSVAQVGLPDIDGLVGVCFTAGDRVDEYLASLPAAVRPAADFAPINGPELFELMRGLKAAGIVVNAGSDDQTALSREDILAARGR